MNNSPPLIALLTDFGQADCYAGVMKGVIHAIAPHALTVDLTHQTPPHSVLIGAALLAQSAPFFAKETIFVGVVDPGVGTERRALVARSEGKYFVGPDNGLFSFVLTDNAQIHTLENRDYALSSVSNTFHGRDIFSPAAAHLANGATLESFGPAIEDPMRIPWPEPVSKGPGLWNLPILASDSFGNLITCLKPETLKRLKISDISIGFGDRRIGIVSPTFGAVGQGEWLAYWGSGGLLEIAINGASASAAAGLGAGDTVLLEDPHFRHPDKQSAGS